MNAMLSIVTGPKPMGLALWVPVTCFQEQPADDFAKLSEFSRYASSM